MPILINPFPVGGQQARFVTGQPVASQHMMSMQNDLAWLCGYVVQPVCSVILPVPGLLPNITNIAYRKSSGAKLLMIQVEVHGGHDPSSNATSAANSQGMLTVTVSGGAATWNRGVGANLFDGTHPISTPSTDTWDHATYAQYLDVSTLTNGAWYDIGLAWADSVTATGSKGLYSINVHELAAPQADPITAPTTEIGESLQWCQARFPIVDGTTTGSLGLERLLGEQERARYQNRRQGMQLIRPENTSDAFAVSSTTPGAAIVYGSMVSTAPKWRIRPRGLYGTTGSNQYLMRVRYKNSSTQQLIIQAAIQPVGGATTYTTYTLANSTSFVATTVSATSAPLVIQIPCSGTNQEADITWTAWQTAAGNSYISQLALAENET